MDMNTATLPKKGLKKYDYNIDMTTLPKKGLKKYDYNIDMEKKNLEKLTKDQLIELLLKQEKKKPKVVIVDDTKPTRLNRPPPIQEVVQRIKPTPPPRTGKWENVKPRPVPRKSVKQMVKKYEDMIQPPDGYKPIPKPRTDRPLQLRIKPPKPTRAPPLPPNDGLNFDDDIFQTENTSLGKFKIISVQSSENKKFKSYTNEFKVKILKKLDDVKEIYHIFQELVKTVKRRRKLSDNDMLRLVIQNEELPNAISTNFNKVENFKLGDLENVINILEYRAIPIEKCKIVVQSVKIPTGKGRLYLMKDTVSRKGCIITVKNDGTTCLARSIVTAMANLHPEK